VKVVGLCSAVCAMRRPFSAQSIHCITQTEVLIDVATPVALAGERLALADTLERHREAAHDFTSAANAGARANTKVATPPPCGPTSTRLTLCRNQPVARRSIVMRVAVRVIARLA
jgi:hypothetical protein